MHHRRLSSFSCQRVHVAWSNRKSDSFFRFSAHTLHVRPKKSIYTGNTDHHNGRSLFTAIADFFYCLRNLFQMTSRYDIGLVHHQIEKTVIIFPHGTDKRSISSTAARCHDQHDRIRHSKSRSFYSESFCSR